MSQLSSDDPLNPKVASSVFDLLQIELVPLAYRVNAEISARDEATMTESSRQHLFPGRTHPSATTRLPDRTLASSAPVPATDSSRANDPDPSIATAATGPGSTTTLPATAAAAATTTHPAALSTTNPLTSHAGTAALSHAQAATAPGNFDPDDAYTRESAQFRLDSLGYRVGQGLAEGYSATLAARPTTQLECIKFVCKDLWTRVFGKQIDNLKTNHRGTFVLTDLRFAPIARVSMDRVLGPKGVDPALARVQTVCIFFSPVVSFHALLSASSFFVPHQDI